MDIRELRIGNYVCFQKRIVKIQGLNIGLRNNLEIIILDTDNCRASCDISHISPILLTDKYLLQCGFKSSFCSDPQEDITEMRWHIPYKKTDKWTIIFNLYEIIGNHRYSFYTYEDTINVKYLHQLQNLYFTLTNEELTIERL